MVGEDAERTDLQPSFFCVTPHLVLWRSRPRAQTLRQSASTTSPCSVAGDRWSARPTLPERQGRKDRRYGSSYRARPWRAFYLSEDPLRQCDSFPSSMRKTNSHRACRAMEVAKPSPTGVRRVIHWFRYTATHSSETARRPPVC